METTVSAADRPNLGELVDVYLMRCRLEGKSPHTLRAYRESLGKFAKALAEDGAPTDPGQVRVDDLYRYMDRFARLTMDSRHRYFREIRCFFNWLVETGYLETSPFRNLRNVRLPKKVVRPFGREDVQALLAACADTAVGLRDRAILILLLDTGLRVSELTGLNLQDIDLDGLRLIVLRGKGNKQRIVPFSPSCRDSLTDYLAVRGGRSSTRRRAGSP